MNISATRPTAECENVTVTAKDGKVYDLGNPNSPLFRLRVTLYKMKRGISNG